MMVRSGCLLVAAVMALGGAACNKPSEGDCKKAVARIRKLHGTEREDPSVERAAIRSCRGSGSKEAIKCIGNAEDLEALRACEGDLYEKMYGDEPIETAPAKPAPAPTAPAPAPTAPTPAPAATAPAPQVPAPAPATPTTPPAK